MAVEHLHDLADPAACRRLVVKIGSALLVERHGEVRRDWLQTVVAEIAAARAHGQQVVVVTSGAIALGAARLGLAGGGRATLPEAQACAAVGQIALAGAWAELLGEHGLIAAQLLLTLDDFEDRARYLNAAATFGRLLDDGAVPVVNENDSIATDEIRFGDNDRLAARVAQACGADAVILLTDVDGLHDRDPRAAGAQRIPLVRGLTDELHAMADGGSGSGMGSGGMASKLQAAAIAERAGIALAIMDGSIASPISACLAAGGGTLFLPVRGEGGRRAWIGGRMRLAGALVVDPGCALALAQGKSLLAAGIASVEGSFARGDVVEVRDAGGRAIAKGVCEYGRDQVAAIAGKRVEDQEALLGHAPRSAVIHRDHLVLM